MSNQFSLDISKFIEHAKGNLDKAVRQAAVLTAQGVVTRTPVDTGRLRGNWMIQSTLTIETVDDVDIAGAATIAKMAGQAMTLKAGGECWIVNSLPYAGEVEYGHSRVKAPAGMVRVTLANLPEALEAYVRGLQ